MAKFFVIPNDSSPGYVFAYDSINMQAGYRHKRWESFMAGKTEQWVGDANNKVSALSKELYPNRWFRLPTRYFLRSAESEIPKRTRKG